MDLKPIPAFYCCYLLRSTVRHSSLYVGSTPNPRRRLAQHNGLIKGGAAKTARATLRPWEMACVVTGFPSQIAALQFEWAWQNTHLTRHIAVPERLTQARTLVRTSPKTGRTRRRPARPRISLTDKLSNLHLLLRVDSFARWPLEVRFFCEDVFGVWQTWTERVDGVIRDGVKVLLDPQLPAAGPEAIVDTVATNSQARGRHRTLGTGGVEGLEVNYQPLKGHIEKSINLLGNDSRSSCAVCHAELDRSLAFVATCPQPACEATSHLQCLSSHFLARDSEESAVIPTEGTCPSCKHGLKWVEFVKELSLRSYGHKEVESLTRPRRKKRQDLMEGNGKIMSSQAHAGVSDADDGDEDLELDDFDNVAAALRASMDLSMPDDVGEKWTYWDDDDDGTASVGSIDSIESELASADTGKAMGREGKRLEIVIEDSDWDEAEVLD